MVSMLLCMMSSMCMLALVVGRLRGIPYLRGWSPQCTMSIWRRSWLVEEVLKLSGSTMSQTPCPGPGPWPRALLSSLFRKKRRPRQQAHTQQIRSRMSTTHRGCTYDDLIFLTLVHRR